MRLNLQSPAETQTQLAQSLRQQRLLQNLTQRSLAKRAGVTLASLKRFEQSGQASLMLFIKLAMALGQGAELEQLFSRQTLRSLDDIPQGPARQRARGRGGE